MQAFDPGLDVGHGLKPAKGAAANSKPVAKPASKAKKALANDAASAWRVLSNALRARPSFENP
mgnify:CR=1 FL=1